MLANISLSLSIFFPRLFLSRLLLNPNSSLVNAPFRIKTKIKKFGLLQGFVDYWAYHLDLGPKDYWA
jgi:hypothetical protein